MDLETFRTYYPEFLATDATIVQAALLRAGAKMGGPAIDPWGPAGTTAMPTIADAAQSLLAADYLIASPFGTETRAQNKGGKSTYRQQYEELEAAMCCGGMVAGVGSSFPVPLRCGRWW